MGTANHLNHKLTLLVLHKDLRHEQLNSESDHNSETKTIKINTVMRKMWELKVFFFRKSGIGSLFSKRIRKEKNCS